MPELNLSAVNYSAFVDKTHDSVVLESDALRVVLLCAVPDRSSARTRNPPTFR